VQLAAYRVVQEALTNVLKHAGPARATVRLAVQDGHMAIEVLDDGMGAAAAVRRGDRTLAGAGRGMAGMRERVEALGGRLSAGPEPGGGFAVRADVPLPADPGRPHR
jgi:signal transduction histidine kinase